MMVRQPSDCLVSLKQPRGSSVWLASGTAVLILGWEHNMMLRVNMMDDRGRVVTASFLNGITPWFKKHFILVEEDHVDD